MSRESRRAPGPGVRSLATLGPELLREDPIDVAVSLRERYGRVVRIPPIYPGLDHAAYLVTDPDDVRSVLQSDPNHYRGLDIPGSDDFAAAVEGSLLGSSEGGIEWWVERLRQLSPEFSERHASARAPDLVRETATLLDEYADADGPASDDPATVPSGDGTVRVRPLFSRLSLRLLGVSLFGPDVRLHEETVVRAVARLRAAFKRRTFGVVVGPLTRRLPDGLLDALREPFTPEWVRDADADDPLDALHRVAERVVARRERHPGAFDDAVTTWWTRPDPVTGETLSRDAAVAEVVGMLIAGFATVSAALTWAVVELARRPRLQRRLAEEAEAAEAAGVFSGTPSYDALRDALPLAFRAWRETLRLYPTLPVFGRTAERDVTLSGYGVEAGSPVLVSPYVTQRDPAFWDDPEAFDPARFRPERARERPEFAYYPFSAGPNGCLGRHLATVEAVVALATLCADYRVGAVDADRPGVDSAINLVPDRDVRVRLARRE